MAGKLVSNEKHTAQELLVHLEEAVRDALEKKGVGRSVFGLQWKIYCV